MTDRILFRTRHLGGALAIAAAATIAASATAQTVVSFDGYTPGGYPVVHSPSNIVVNGDFNLDPLVDPANEFATNPNVTGWTIDPAGEYSGTRNSNYGVDTDGRGLSLGAWQTLTNVSQVLPTLLGQSYRLSFFFAVDGEEDNLFRVYAGDEQLWNLDGLAPAIGRSYFSQYLDAFVATGPSTLLRFEYLSPTGFQHLSNVTVVPIPEPETWALLLAGLGVAGVFGRRPQRRSRSRPTTPLGK